MGRKRGRTGGSARDHLILLALLFSGFAALGYELLWTRLLSLALGNELLGVLGVLAGFFGGMVIGTFLLGSRVTRVRNPARWFVIMELITAVYALISPHLLYKLSSVIPRMLGPLAGDNDTLPALGITVFTAGAVLLPGTFCMGPTLVFLVEARRRVRTDEAGGKGVGRLYAANTLGATLGILASVYLLFPAVGLVYGAILLACIGGFSAVLAWRWQKHYGSHAVMPLVEDVPAGTRDGVGPLYVILFLTGMAGLGYEIAAIHILSQILENTVYTFANLLAFYLVGTAAGAWFYQRRRRIKDRSGDNRIAVVLIVSMMVCLGLTAWQLRYLPAVADRLLVQGSSYFLHLRGEFLLAGYIFFLPAAVMGALFSHLMGYRAGQGLGSAYGFNTLGAALAPFVIGILAIRLLGYIDTLYLVLAMYLLSLFVYAWRYRCGIKPVCIGTVVAMVVLGLSPHAIELIEIPRGWRLVDSKEGPMGHVIVREQLNPPNPAPFPLRLLQVNMHHRMGGMYGFADRRMGHMPLLLAGGARRVLFLGIGTGGTVGCTRYYPLEHVDAVEICPDVVDMLHHFKGTNEGVEHLERVQIHKADARRFVKASRDRYDLIIGDLFHPGRDGAGMLYTMEHFEALRERVVPGGLVVQWLSLEQYDEESLRVVVRTFLSVFPESHAFLGNYTALQPVMMLAGKTAGGRAGGLSIDLPWLMERFQVFEDQVPVLQDIEDFFSCYFSGPEELNRFAGKGPVNRDLDPILLYRAPRAAYEKKPGSENLGRLMPYRRRWRPEMVRVADEEQSAWLEDPAAKRWKAVGQYLRGDLLMAAGSPPAVSSGVDAFIEAYRTDSTYRAVNERLYILSSSNSPHAERIQAVLSGNAPR